MKLFLSESDIVALMDNELDLENNTNNPFDQLPSNVVDGFLNFTCKSIFVLPSGVYLPRQYLPRAIEYLPLLITPHLTELEIPWKAGGEIHIRKKDAHFILRLASVRSKQLKILRMQLKFNYDSTFPFYINLISKFSKLQVLDLSTDDRLLKLPRFPSAQDEFLHLLGQHCTEIRELSAEDHPITDAGIRGLCVIGNCRSIRLLNFYGCKAITNQGIKTALDNLPFLKILRNEATIDGLAEIAQNAADQGLPFPKYALPALYIFILKETVYKAGSLEKSVLLVCPYITQVDMALMCDGIVKDADLVSLLSLKNLYILKIVQFLPVNFNEVTFRYSGGITFEGGVLPLLKKFGNSLKILELYVFFLDLDILTIMQFCHKLQYLYLHMRSKYDRWPKEEEQNR
ncbi:hypothetical protein DAPPUDRAFT_323979 [Daphnia pulex]|uniref:Uncharacterized protein n=1 Tax=Daphnia pulex TaxID=6669 RepID=E9H0C9_DAPPU|nr:hypothetical protein DAPPUDRAFT_323979 [Daphnia pulex]|eukprot:EFX74785.1 hypothetical protein DAPPUDRAFT_323979 [Daphnia pulex]